MTIVARRFSCLLGGKYLPITHFTLHIRLLKYTIYDPRISSTNTGTFECQQTIYMKHTSIYIKKIHIVLNHKKLIFWNWHPPWSHLWFAEVHECPPWCSIAGATVTLHQFFCILHLSAFCTFSTFKLPTKYNITCKWFKVNKYVMSHTIILSKR